MNSQDPPEFELKNTNCASSQIYRDAVISPCGKFRWLLDRSWCTDAVLAPQYVLWIMLNPSMADAKIDDQTIHRCMHFTRQWGFVGLRVVNAYPFRSSNVEECQAWASDPSVWKPKNEMEKNLRVIEREARQAHLIVAAWGAIAWDQVWMNRIVRLIQKDIYCLGSTLSGDPKHPMARGIHRVPNDQQPVLWQSR